MAMNGDYLDRRELNFLVEILKEKMDDSLNFFLQKKILEKELGRELTKKEIRRLKRALKRKGKATVYDILPEEKKPPLRKRNKENYRRKLINFCREMGIELKCPCGNNNIDELEVHHINGLRSDNSIDNLVILCKKHHTELHEQFIRKYIRGFLALHRPRLYKEATRDFIYILKTRYSET